LAYVAVVVIPLEVPKMPWHCAGVKPRTSLTTKPISHEKSRLSEYALTDEDKRQVNEGQITSDVKQNPD
jgi:hypothetical protein